MIIPDDMVRRWKATAQRRGEEFRAADQKEAVRNRRHVMIALIAGICGGVAVISIITLISQAP